jgi:predicted nucleic acid-binding protein
VGATALRRGQRVFPDCNAIIHFAEDVEPYVGILAPVFEAAQAGEITIVTSAISLLVALVAPLREGDTQKADVFRAIIRDSSGVDCRPVTDDVLERAASLRAASGLRTPDAIVAATSLLARCDLFITNDAALLRVGGLGAVILSRVAET